ncbi:DMT family transporter [Pseudogemmobacter sp. W21_MBD1_M6]|uniref:DMT family transporter n=1 Tax=Pseudogemmobacter sp. W21_MBD1_M6 TaxID=3240271 RepID=UPI003F94C08E
MRLILLTSLTMIAFAANSVLNRLALADGAMGPASFALIRLTSGALVLVALCAFVQGRFSARGRHRMAGTASLALYILGFSFAYVSLDAGVGALILFGGVQVTMFGGAVMAGERLPRSRWLGAALAFSGLVYLMWPAGALRPNGAGALLMVFAAFGWGVYSLLGRAVGNPLQSTAANFLLAVPIALIVWIALPDAVTARGAWLAMVSGVVTSGLGYALWYTVLPRLGASRAAIAQLTVPVIALAGGIAVLGEGLTLRFGVACLLVMGGVVIGLAPQRTITSSGS